MPKILIPKIDTHSSVSGLVRDLQPVLDQLAVALPDFFEARESDVVETPAVGDGAVPVAVLPKPARVRKPAPKKAK